MKDGMGSVAVRRRFSSTPSATRDPPQLLIAAMPAIASARGEGLVSDLLFHPRGRGWLHPGKGPHLPPEDREERRAGP